MDPAWQGKRVTVLGLGRSGRSAARLLVKLGAYVFISDQGRPGPEVMKWLKNFGGEYEIGGHSARCLEAGLIVASPGIRPESPIMVQARKKGLEIIGEIELAYRASQARMVAVTGTNGKSTTTSMIGAIINQAGMRCLVGGNLAPGRPLCDLALEAEPGDIIAAEVSSFQLETIKYFRPKVAVVTNITEDHLDRHPDLKAYALSKARIFENQDIDDFAVINADDLNTARFCQPKSAVLKFGFQRDISRGAWCDGQGIYLMEEDQRVHLMNVAELPLPGRHNVENAMAAICASRALECPLDAMAEALKKFTGIPHRLEKVAVLDGVTYINNSMCTNPAAGAKSLEAMDGPVIVIAGGREKGLDMKPYLKAIGERASSAILMGESRQHLESGLRAMGFENISLARDMDEAVGLAALQAKPGWTVLFSPGCSSFDMFADFEARGQAFKQAVWNLKKK